MNNSTNITTALYLGRLIYTEYQKLLDDCTNINSINQILYLKDLEEETLRKITFDKDTVESIETIFQENTREQESSILYGIESDIEGKEYPYFRLMAYVQNYIKNEYSLKSINNTLIALLYKSLSEFDDLQIKKRALLILMNSPITERQILENKLEPLEEIYDTTELEVELRYTVEMIKKQKSNSSSRRHFRFAGNDEKVAYFIEELMTLEDYLSKTQIHHKENDVQHTIIKSYLNSLIAILDLEDLDDIRSNCLDILSRPDIQEFVTDSFEEAPKLIELKRKVSFIKLRE